MLPFIINTGEKLFDIVINQPILSTFLFITIEEFAIPLPLPGEILIVFTGYQISLGTVSYWHAVISYLFAVILGATILYIVSVKWGNIIVKKYGKYIHLNERKLTFLEKWFHKYGVIFIIVGRIIPGFRIPVTVFSGMSGIAYIDFVKTLVIPTLLWIMFYLYVGQIFGLQAVEFIKKNHWIVLLLVLPLFIGVLMYLTSKIRRSRKEQK